MVDRAGTFGYVPVLSGEGIQLVLSGKEILHQVDFEVYPGEFVGLLGPNGSGKTSLLRVLNSIYRPSSGRILLKGKSLEQYSSKERAREMAFMMQNESEAVTFSVLDVLLSGRYPYRKGLEGDSEQDREAARRTLHFVGLEGFEERRFHTLSSGERQLVIFARTLMQDTDVVLLDEPVSNLDIAHRQQIFRLASDLAERGKAVVAALHTMHEAAEYCSRLLLLKEGRIHAKGTSGEVLVPQLVDPVFGISSVSSRSILSGAPEVQLLPQRTTRKVVRRIHLVGGGGSAAEASRILYRCGFEISGSPVFSSDPDGVLWKLLDIPFTPIPDYQAVVPDVRNEETALIQESDFVVLCGYPFSLEFFGLLGVLPERKPLYLFIPEKECGSSSELLQRVRLLGNSDVRIISERSLAKLE